MKRREKPLSETNPYMRDPKLRDKMILVSAASSAAIEGIRVSYKVIAKGLRPGWKPPRPRRRRSSARPRILSSRSAFVVFPPVPRHPATKT